MKSERRGDKREFSSRCSIQERDCVCKIRTRDAMRPYRVQYFQQNVSK